MSRLRIGMSTAHSLTVFFRFLFNGIQPEWNHLWLEIGVRGVAVLPVWWSCPLFQVYGSDEGTVAPSGDVFPVGWLLFSDFLEVNFS